MRSPPGSGRSRMTVRRHFLVAAIQFCTSTSRRAAAVTGSTARVMRSRPSRPMSNEDRFSPLDWLPSSLRGIEWRPGAGHGIGVGSDARPGAVPYRAVGPRIGCRIPPGAWCTEPGTHVPLTDARILVRANHRMTRYDARAPLCPWNDGRGCKGRQRRGEMVPEDMRLFRPQRDRVIDQRRTPCRYRACDCRHAKQQPDHPEIRDWIES